MSYCEYVLDSSLIFWSIYFFLGLRCERFQKLPMETKREVMERLLKNVVVSLVTSSIFFACFGFPASASKMSWKLLYETWFETHGHSRVLSLFSVYAMAELPKMFASLLVADALFFHLHWIFHHIPRLLVFHRIHHRFHVPLKITAVYCHWTEMAFINMMTILVGPRLFHMHSWAFYLWIIGACLFTMLEHDLKKIGPFDPDHHLIHHIVSSGVNYGQIRFWDWLYGTLAYREKNPAGQIHIKLRDGTIVGTESALETLPLTN